MALLAPVFAGREDREGAHAAFVLATVCRAELPGIDEHQRRERAAVAAHVDEFDVKTRQAREVDRERERCGRRPALHHAVPCAELASAA